MDRQDDPRESRPARFRDAPAPDERHVSPQWLASYWGVHVHTVYRDIRKGALPAARLPGGQIRVRWIDARRYGRPLD